MKLNLGCGPDHKEGFLGIDISPECNPDLVFDFEKESLLAHFEEGSIEGILAFDIIEHMLHIYAVKVLAANPAPHSSCFIVSFVYANL